jgi:hypothetical protein
MSYFGPDDQGWGYLILTLACMAVFIVWAVVWGGGL